MYTFSPRNIIRSSEVNANFAGLASGAYDDTANSLSLTRDEALQDFVASGCIWTGDSYGSTLSGSMSAGVAYVSGIRLAVAAVTAYAFAASKDTYIDVTTTGALTYTAVTLNAASPALAAGSVRIGIVTTEATSIANATSINQGNITGVTPAASGTFIGVGAFDSLANSINPRLPFRRLVGSFARQSGTTTGAPGGSPVPWNACNYIAFRADANSNYCLSIEESIYSGYTGTGRLIFYFYLGTTANAYTTLVQEFTNYMDSATTGMSKRTTFNSGSYSGLTFLSIKIDSSGWSGTCTMNASAQRPAIYAIEKL
jgi:hypothetical protein